MSEVEMETPPAEKIRSIAENVARVKARMEQAARRAGRDPGVCAPRGCE